MQTYPACKELNQRQRCVSAQMCDYNDMGHAMQKCAFGHKRTVKAQECEGWSGPSLSAARIIGFYRVFQWRAKARIKFCACAGWCESADFAHARRHFFVWHGLFISGCLTGIDTLSGKEKASLWHCFCLLSEKRSTLKGKRKSQNLLILWKWWKCNSAAPVQLTDLNLYCLSRISATWIK